MTNVTCVLLGIRLKDQKFKNTGFEGIACRIATDKWNWTRCVTRLTDGKLTKEVFN